MRVKKNKEPPVPEDAPTSTELTVVTEESRVAAQKEAVINSLTKGVNVTTIATNVGISRQTIYNWLKQPEFVAALELRQRENDVAITQRRKSVTQSIADRTLMMQNLATSDIFERVTSGNKLVRLPRPDELSVLERLGRLTTAIRMEERLNAGQNTGKGVSIEINSTHSITSGLVPESAKASSQIDQPFANFLRSASDDALASTDKNNLIGDVVIAQLLETGALDEIRDAELIESDNNGRRR